MSVKAWAIKTIGGDLGYGWFGLSQGDAWRIAAYYSRTRGETNEQTIKRLLDQGFVSCRVRITEIEERESK